MNTAIRPVDPADGAFLTEMLVAAAFWRPDGPVGTRDAVLSDPRLARYTSGWPQPGDIGVIAEAEEPIGAAWLRFFVADDPGYGFIESCIPEVSMGVSVPWRSRGVGRRLLKALVLAAREASLPALSLSVEADNYALQLYESCGFRSVTRASGSVTMRLTL
jgi:GNAT superfamily N-acetyltransferase